MELAERIRRVREAYGLSQLEVADRIGIAASTYGKMERHASHCSYETLSKIAEALGVRLAFLLDVTIDEFKEKNSL